MRPRRRQTPQIATLLPAAAALAVAGCASAPAPQPEPPARVSAAAASPVLLGGDNGLELRWWVTSADQGALAAALSPFANRPVPIDARQRNLLEANGLRLIAVPVDHMDQVQAALGVAGAQQRQWLGQVPAWLDAVPGPVRPDGVTLAMHDGALHLGPGRLRLLLRCWTVPVPPAATGAPDTALHLELVPQHRDWPETAQRDDELRLSPPSLAPEDQGLLFSRLLTRMTVPQGDAYLLIPETPGVQWQQASIAPTPPPAPSPTTAPGKPSPAPTATPAPASEVGQVIHSLPAPTPPVPPAKPDTAAGPAIAGPPSARMPSLGEAMLMSTVEDPQPRAVRAIILLIPHVPDRFDLVAR